MNLINRENSSLYVLLGQAEAALIHLDSQGITVRDIIIVPSRAVIKIDPPPASAAWLHGSCKRRIVHNGNTHITLVARVMGAIVEWEVIEPIAEQESRHA